MMGEPIYTTVGIATLILLMFLLVIPEAYRDYKRFGVPGVKSSLRYVVREIVLISLVVTGLYALVYAVGFLVVEAYSVLSGWF